MTIVGTTALPELATPAAPRPVAADGTAAPHEGRPGVPEAPPEGAPSRGDLQAMLRARSSHMARGADAPGRMMRGAQHGMQEIKSAVKESVRDALQSGVLTDEQAEGLKDAARELRAELRDARQLITPGDPSSAEAAFAAVSSAVEGFFGELDALTAASGEAGAEVDAEVDAVDVAPVAVEDAEGAEVVALADEPDVAAAADDEGADVSAIPVDAEEPVSTTPDRGPFDSVREAISAALDNFWSTASGQGGGMGTTNPYAGFYAAVGELSSPSTEVVSTTVAVG